MNLVKGTPVITLTIDVAGLAHIHKHYLNGLKAWWPICTEHEARKSKELLGKMERIIMHSGYMSEAELNARYATNGIQLHSIG